MTFPIGSTVRYDKPLWKVHPRMQGREGIVIAVSKYGDMVNVKFAGNISTSRIYVTSLTLVRDKNQIETPGYYGC